MKKTSLKTLVAYLNGENVDISEVKAELTAELTGYEAEAAVKRSEYDAIRDAVFGVMSTVKPMTVAEIFDAAASKLPKGATKGKVQYGLLNYWTDRVEKISEPKQPNTYRLK